MTQAAHSRSAAPALRDDDRGWTVTVPLQASHEATTVGFETAASGHQTVFVAGILTNRAELTASAGVSPHTTSAHTILALFRRDGESVLKRLRGSFTVALVDREVRRAVLARDPLGSRPLFFAEHHGTLVCAATPTTLFRAHGVPSTPNRAALADHLCHRWTDPRETFFEHVQRVPPGSCLQIAGGRFTVARYWDPLPADEPSVWATAAEVEQFDRLFEQAVARCTDQGRPGVFLSGGLDSISIAAVASDRARTGQGAMPRALSLGFAGTTCDERDVQRTVAQALGMPASQIDFTAALGGRGLLEQAAEVNIGLPSPLLNTWAPAYLTLARAGVAQGVETVMSGSGGDEWMTVSPLLAADLIRRGDLTGFLRFLSVWQRSFAYSRARLLWSGSWTFGLRPLAGVALHRVAPQWWQASRQRRAVGRDPEWVAPDPALKRQQVDRAARWLGPSNPSSGFYFQEVRSSLDHPLTSLEFEEQFEFGHRVGVRFMHPYWDADLVDLLYRTPPEVLDKGGWSKGLVRRTLAGRFPDLALNRQRKVPATTFYRSILTREAPALLNRVGNFPALTALGVVDGRARAAADEALMRPGVPLYRIWDLINLETWVRPYVN